MFSSADRRADSSPPPSGTEETKVSASQEFKHTVAIIKGTGTEGLCTELQAISKEMTNRFFAAYSIGHDFVYSSPKETDDKNEYETIIKFKHKVPGFVGYIHWRNNPELLKIRPEIEISLQGSADWGSVVRDLEDEGPGFTTFKGLARDLVGQTNSAIGKFYEALKKSLGKDEANETIANLAINIYGHSLGGADAQNLLFALMSMRLRHAQHNGYHFNKIHCFRLLTLCAPGTLPKIAENSHILAGILARGGMKIECYRVINTEDYVPQFGTTLFTDEDPKVVKNFLISCETANGATRWPLAHGTQALNAHVDNIFKLDAKIGSFEICNNQTPSGKAQIKKLLTEKGYIASFAETRFGKFLQGNAHAIASYWLPKVESDLSLSTQQDDEHDPFIGTTLRHSTELPPKIPEINVPPQQAALVDFLLGKSTAAQRKNVVEKVAPAPQPEQQAPDSKQEALQVHELTAEDKETKRASAPSTPTHRSFASEHNLIITTFSPPYNNDDDSAPPTPLPSDKQISGAQLTDNENAARLRVQEFINNKIYWQSKSHALSFRSQCPYGIRLMQSPENESLSAADLFDRYREIANSRRQRSCISSLLCCFFTNLNRRDPVTAALYRAFTQANSFIELERNKDYFIALNNAYEVEDPSPSSDLP